MIIMLGPVTPNSIRGSGVALGKATRAINIAWFSFNLATSAIILSTTALSKALGNPHLQGLAKSLAYANTIVYTIIAVLYTLGIILGTQHPIRMLRDPARSSMLSTISIATMLLALDWGLALHSKPMVALFFYSGLALHTILFIAIMYSLERHPA